MAADATPIELSIVIATYNRAAMLSACLLALARQTQPATDFEVVVVVDGSTDDTLEVLNSFDAPFALRVIWQPNSGQAAAINRGLAAAAGSYCLLLDDDILAEPQLVAEHLRAQREGGGIVGLGYMACSVPERADGFARHFADWWASHYSRRQSREPRFTDCFGGNMSAPRAALLAVGGVAAGMARMHDVELGYRLQRHGLPLVFLPRAAARQEYRKQFREIAADTIKSGQDSVELYRRYPDTLPFQPLGNFNDAGLRAILLRRLLLALGVPVRPLALVGPLLGKARWEREWYRFLERYCYWRGVRQAVPDRETWRRLTHGTPILMYHAFDRSRKAAHRYTIPARRFARQLAWLKWRRYHVLTLGELLRYRRAHELPPARSVVLTIDDGYDDIRSIAYPLLRRYGFAATVFLVSGAIGASNRWDGGGELAGRPLLPWPALREMMSSGAVTYGAHTRTHIALPQAEPERLVDEVAGSRVDLERGLQTSIDTFSWSYGEHDARSVAAVEGARFTGACIVQPGLNSAATPCFKLHRIEVYGTDSLLRFICGLWAGNMEALWRRKHR